MRSVRRSWWLVVPGVVLAGALAIFAYARPVFSHGYVPRLVPRQGEVWQGEAVLFVTQSGFPWGRTVPHYATTDPRIAA